MLVRCLCFAFLVCRVDCWNHYGLCEDNHDYRSPIGLECFQHRGTNCSSWVYIGYDEGELESNCPGSCDVECRLFALSGFPSPAPSNSEQRVTTSVYLIITSVPSLMTGSTQDFFERVTYRMFSKIIRASYPGAFLEQLTLQSQNYYDDEYRGHSKLGHRSLAYYETSLLVQLYGSALTRSFDQSWFETSLLNFVDSAEYEEDLRVNAFFEFCTVRSTTQQYLRSSDADAVTADNTVNNAEDSDTTQIIIFATTTIILVGASFVAGMCCRKYARRYLQHRNSGESLNKSFFSLFFVNADENEAIVASNQNGDDASFPFDGRGILHDRFSNGMIEDVLTRGDEETNIGAKSSSADELQSNRDKTIVADYISKPEKTVIPPMVVFKNNEPHVDIAHAQDFIFPSKNNWFPHIKRSKAPFNLANTVTNGGSNRDPTAFSNMILNPNTEEDKKYLKCVSWSKTKLESPSDSWHDNDQSTSKRSVERSESVVKKTMRHHHQCSTSSFRRHLASQESGDDSSPVLRYHRKVFVEGPDNVASNEFDTDNFNSALKRNETNYTQTSHRRTSSSGGHSTHSHQRDDSGNSVSTSASLANEIASEIKRLERNFKLSRNKNRHQRGPNLFDGQLKTRSLDQGRNEDSCSVVSGLTSVSALTNSPRSRTMETFSTSRSVVSTQVDVCSLSSSRAGSRPALPSAAVDDTRTSKTRHTRNRSASSRGGSLHFHDRNASDESFARKNYYYTFDAPSMGKLGLVIESSKTFGPTVYSVKDYSPLFGMVQPSDKIVRVNYEPTGHMSTSEVTKLLARFRGENDKKKIRITIASTQRKPNFKCDDREDLCHWISGANDVEDKEDLQSLGSLHMIGGEIPMD